MVFPAILAVIPVAKVIAVQVATAFGIAAAKKAGESHRKLKIAPIH